MTGERVNIAVRFFGGAGNFTTVLREMLTFIDDERPSEVALLEWIKVNTRASSERGIRRRLSFIQRIGLLAHSNGVYCLTPAGSKYLESADPEFLYTQLTANVKGFEAILDALATAPRTDTDLVDVVTERHPEYGWTSADGPAMHRGWLQSLGYVRRENQTNYITDAGRAHITTTTAPGLYLQPVSAGWQAQFMKTVAAPVEATTDSPEILTPYLPGRIWGTTAGPQKSGYFEQMQPGDYVLFYQEGEFFAAARIKEPLESTAIGEWLWDSPESRFTFVLTQYQDWAPSIERIWELLQYEGRQVVGGFQRVDDERVQRVREEYGSLEAALFVAAAEPTTSPSLDDLGTDSPNRRTTVQDQLQRDQQLVDALKALYDHHCQVCDRRLEQGDGKGYSEAHHIRPLGEPHNGPDKHANMLVLCPNHHADFDNGMLSVDLATHEITHQYDETCSGKRLETIDTHDLGVEYLEYHNTEICE